MGGAPPPPRPCPTAILDTHQVSLRPLCHQETLAGPPCWEISSGLVVSLRLRRLIARRFATEVVPKLLVVTLAAAVPLERPGAPGGGGGMADALAAALQKRKEKVSKSDDESDNDEW
ncbi:hypothetical protein CDV31_015536 [Fusarium ambrosium]|uniref:Uncharacterized protein n=1 Tax=Fusarium ambrosium TaxID=131363 RepID=A0A428SMX2_9HYPO|nr:hypothetical protein CDV31_015536 [Fusarium ambrosium]